MREKTDGAASPLMGRAVNDAWTRWKADRPSHAVFWLFIEEARNAIIKEFELKAGRGVHIPFDTHSEVLCHVYIPKFEHLDQPALLDLAIEWWETELDIIERAAG